MIPGKTKLVMVESPTNPRMQVSHVCMYIGPEGWCAAEAQATCCSLTVGQRELALRHTKTVDPPKIVDKVC